MRAHDRFSLRDPDARPWSCGGYEGGARTAQPSLRSRLDRKAWGRGRGKAPGARLRKVCAVCGKCGGAGLLRRPKEAAEVGTLPGRGGLRGLCVSGFSAPGGLRRRRPGRRTVSGSVVPRAGPGDVPLTVERQCVLKQWPDR